MANLSSMVMSELQRANPDHNFENQNIYPSSSSSFPQQQMAQPDQMMQSQEQIATIRNAFMQLVENSPQLSDYFSKNQQNFQSVVNDPNIMLQVLSDAQQQAQQQTEQFQSQQSPPSSSPQQQQQQEEKDKKDFEEMATQYTDLGDVVLPKDKTFTERLINDLKIPIIMALLFLFLSRGYVTDLIQKYIPRVGGSPPLTMFVIFVVFLLFAYLVVKLLR